MALDQKTATWSGAADMPSCTMRIPRHANRAPTQHVSLCTAAAAAGASTGVQEQRCAPRAAASHRCCSSCLWHKAGQVQVLGRLWLRWQQWPASTQSCQCRHVI
jgi:hypothetical protein